jgi:uncharacterized membrane protein
MRDRPDDLIAGIIVAILLILTIDITPDSVLRPILGIFFLLVTPGYVALAAIFPGRDGPDTIERIALTFGLSISIFAIVGLTIYYAFSGVTLESIEFALAGLVIVTAFIAWERRTNLPEDERYVINVEINASIKGMPFIDRLLVVGIVVTAAFSLVMLYFILSPTNTTLYNSEIGLLGPTGQTAGYPWNLTLGQATNLNVSVHSKEVADTAYSLVILLQPENLAGPGITHWDSGDPFNGLKKIDSGLAMAFNFTLAPDQYMNSTFDFSVNQSGTYKLRFMLFYEGQDVNGIPPYEGYIWVNVKGP